MADNQGCQQDLENLENLENDQKCEKTLKKTWKMTTSNKSVEIIYKVLFYSKISPAAGIIFKKKPWKTLGGTLKNTKKDLENLEKPFKNAPKIAGKLNYEFTKVKYFCMKIIFVFIL